MNSPETVVEKPVEKFPRTQIVDLNGKMVYGLEEMANGSYSASSVLNVLLHVLVSMHDPRVDDSLKTFGIQVTDVEGKTLFPRT